MPRPTTMQDVADKAGVSKALVSMIFRNVPGPSEATRQRVMDVADELNYRRNRPAALLSLHRTRLIGVMADISNSFHAELVDFLVDEAEIAGYEVVLGPVTARRTPDRVIDTLLDFRCEALVLLDAQLAPEELQAVARRAAVLSLGQRVPGSVVDVVRAADGQGVALVVDHLVSLGHTDIVYASGPGTVGADRATGYRRAMTRHELEPTVLRAGFTEVAGSALASELLTHSALPSAVVCANDRCAIGLMDTMQRNDVSIPGDLSVTGYDDSQLAQLAHVALTSVNQNPREQAERAVAAVLERLDAGRSDPVSVVLRPRLVLRRTTGARPH